MIEIYLRLVDLILTPVIMLLAVLGFILLSILAFFTGGSVPVPAAVAALPNMNAMTNNMGNLFNTVKNTVNGAVNGAVNTVNHAVNQSMKQANQLMSMSRSNNKNGISRSFLETI